MISTLRTSVASSGSALPPSPNVHCSFRAGLGRAERFLGLGMQVLSARDERAAATIQDHMVDGDGPELIGHAGQVGRRVPVADDQGTRQNAPRNRLMK